MSALSGLDSLLLLVSTIESTSDYTTYSSQKKQATDDSETARLRAMIDKLQQTNRDLTQQIASSRKREQALTENLNTLNHTIQSLKQSKSPQTQQPSTLPATQHAETKQAPLPMTITQSHEVDVKQTDSVDLKKYDKMKKMGIPHSGVRNQMVIDGIDKGVIATYFHEAQGSQHNAESADKRPNMDNYITMRKIGMTELHIRSKMNRDGVDPYWIRDFFEEHQPMIGIDGKRAMQPPAGGKPDVSKYSKMQKVGGPTAKQSIKNKMKFDGIHEYWIRDFFGEPQPMQHGRDKDVEVEEEEEMKPPPGGKPDLSKYERSKKLKLPPVSIKNKMKMDGIHEYWQCVFLGEPIPKIKKKGSDKKKKKTVKRKVQPLHWTKLTDDGVIWDNTIWATMTQKIDAKVTETPTSLQITTITTETLITSKLSVLIEKLFSNVKPTKKKKKGDSVKKKKKDEEQKKEITLIDAKRAFNMIVGLRQFEKLNINDIKIRDYLLKLDHTKLNIEMLDKLSKFVPKNEELNELRNFKGDRKKLARSERFVDVMTCMVDIDMRIDLWQFKMKFRGNVFEIESRINKIRATLDALKTSKQIASFLKICLIIGNFINEGTNRGAAKGIKLKSSIDRLASMKTVDKTQSMLAFIMQHIFEEYNNNGEFDGFPDELIQIVQSAKKIEEKTIRDGINDMKVKLGRIGKRIKRTSRNLQQLQMHFHKSMGDALRAMHVLRTKASIKLRESKLNVLAMADEQDTKMDDVSTKKKAKTKESVLDIDDEEETKMSNEEKPDKFVIVDASYTGNKKVRKRRASHLRSKSVGDILRSVAETDDVEIDDDKKRKLKRVKIRRMKRVRKKEEVEVDVSAKTVRTIQRLKVQKDVEKEVDEKSTDKRKQTVSFGDSKSAKKAAEDPNNPPEDKFESMMTGFHTMAVAKVEALEKQFENLKIFAGNVAVYFGEHDDLEWEELFEIFVSVLVHIQKAMKQNADLKEKQERERKKKEREEAKKVRMAKKGLKPKANVNDKDNEEPTNILEEIRMKKKRGTLQPSKAKKDVVGYERMDENATRDQRKAKGDNK